MMSIENEKIIYKKKYLKYKQKYLLLTQMYGKGGTQCLCNSKIIPQSPIIDQSIINNDMPVPKEIPILWKIPIPVPNLGNSCYMGAVLQLFFNNPEIINFFKTNQSNSDNNFQFFLNEFKNYKRKTSYDATRIYNFEKIKNYFNTNIKSQNDVSDFLMTLFNAFFERVHICRELFNFEYLQIEYNTESEQAIEFRTGIDSILKLVLKNSLDESIQYYNLINPENRRFSYKIKKFSKILIIELIRYQFDQTLGDIIKLNDPINIPIILQFNDPNCEAKFNIYGAIIHQGDGSGGHYVSILKSNDKYYYCNDSNVSEITSEDFLNYLKNSYLIMYTKISE